MLPEEIIVTLVFTYYLWQNFLRARRTKKLRVPFSLARQRVITVINHSYKSCTVGVARLAEVGAFFIRCKTNVVC